MKIIIAPQAFKGSIGALQAADAMSHGVKQVFPNASCVLIPVADGGDGTLEILKLGTRDILLHSTKANNAMGNPEEAFWGEDWARKEAIIEIAKICGIASLTEKKPGRATSYGVGEVIKAAWGQGIRRFFIGLGGSATTDGGAGMAASLGIKFLDSRGKELPLGGIALSKLAKIDTSQADPRILESEFIAGCDVTNPLVGAEGAALSFAFQKGAAPKMCHELEAALLNFAAVIEKDLGVQVKELPFGGAAGGLGAGMHVFLRAKLLSGIEEILNRVNFNEHLKGASFIITGEGRVDHQIRYHKTIWGIAEKAKEKKIPVIAISGQLEEKMNLEAYGLEACLPLSFIPGIFANDPAQLIASATEQAMRLIKVGISTR